MVIYRKAKPEERESYIDFADMVFTTADGVPLSFEASIPKVYGKGVDSAHMQNIAVDDEKGIRGLIAVMPNELYVGGETLKTGFVGTVSVHPQARGEGHMKKLMRMCMDEMLAQGVDLALLNGQRQRYEYFGYVKGGVGYIIDVETRNVRHALKNVSAEGVTFEEIDGNSPWREPARRLFEKRIVHFRRDSEQFVDCCRTYLNHPWAILRDGEFVGYFVSNEKKNFIVETCTVTAADFDAAIKAWMAEFGVNRMQLMFPEWEQEMLAHLGSYAENIHMQEKVQSCVLNPRRVVSALLRVKAGYAALADGAMSFDVEGDCFRVTVYNGEVRVEDGGEGALQLSRLEATRLFMYPFLYEGRPKTPQGWFPLPLYAAAPDEF